MHFKASAVRRHDRSKVFHLFLCPLACVRIGMKMHRFNQHAALRHHPCGNRAVDSARKERQPFSVCTQRKTSESRNFSFIDVRTVVTHIHMQEHIRLVNIDFQHLAAD